MSFYFTGQVSRIIFENPSNFFKILLFELEDTDSDFDEDEIIITGTMADIIEDESYTFWGQLVNHPRYGQQVTVERYERAKPTATGLVSYFSSQQFTGIGKKTAQKIIDLYGDDPIDKILEDPSKLEGIHGLSKANRDKFVNQLKVNYGSEQILSKLAEYGLTGKAALQIFETYKEESLTIIQDNPYQLVEDIKGIGFKIADNLAKELGIEDDSPKRFRAAMIHLLKEISLDEGHTYVQARDLLERAIFLLEESRQIEIQPKLVAQELSQLIADDKVQHVGTKIFENSLFHAEKGIHKHLSRLLTNNKEIKISQDKLDDYIQDVEESLAISYDNIQRDAIKEALTNQVFILTGGPGTGKTTVINGIIQVYAQLHHIDLHKKDIPILLAAPTGRAARRMNELTGLASATIHRHLGLTGDSNDFQTLDDYLDADLIIVDEFSMVDTWLAHQLLSAISSNTQVIIVGDSDQLPSVGPGQVLADLLKIPELPKVNLERIFRQSEESTIVTLASHIRQGELPQDFTQKKADRSYFEAQPQHIPDMTSKIVTAAIKSGIDPQEIQVLAPIYRGQAGISNLNNVLQDLLNPLDGRTEFLFNDSKFRLQDRILHLVNDAEANVFNGDIGTITDLIPAKYTESKQDEIYLDFDGSEIIYPRSEWYKITLAYAMSIHKSQGSEFQVVILPITRQSGRLLQRNLIYTAITRSKSKLILLGELQAFKHAVLQQSDQRQTYLVEHFHTNSEVIHRNREDLYTVVDDFRDKSESNNPKTVLNQVQEDSTPYSQLVDKTVQDVGNQVNKILTETNWVQIDPLIGLDEADFDIFR